MTLQKAGVAVCLVGAIILILPIGVAAVTVGAIFSVAAGTIAAIVPPPSLPSDPTHQSPVGTPPLRLAPSSQTQPPVPTGGGLALGWATRGPLNQYARSNYQSDQSWLTWRDADCSAAALAWLLGAYGRPVDSLEEAIALIGSGTGISPSLGLLDARGPALARALSASGLHPRTPGTRPLGSRGELQAWLDQGPLLMDGARWFGEGHWFVAIGYDAAGILIRDSSGWDTRYLTWSRLYGEVGFSGWVIGVTS